MPGAPREYRKGIHEGVDFYDSDNCAFVGLGTEVVAAKAGTVVRADGAYEDLTEESLAELEARVDEVGGSSEEIEDAFRGRQVWIEHADGLVTRYAHLAGIAEDLEVGMAVAQGELVAYVGESGTPESVREPGTQVHVHFEIRIGESYLGAGLGADAARALYQAAFSL
jgi:murein DD-endopeptidase MepM/ murein hydrolase activator NlpD